MTGKLLVLVMVLFATTGCAEAAAVVANGASMLVACVLLWSTVSLGKRE
jgi:hypothetical protein